MSSSYRYSSSSRQQFASASPSSSHMDYPSSRREKIIADYRNREASRDRSHSGSRDRTPTSAAVGASFSSSYRCAGASAAYEGLVKSQSKRLSPPRPSSSSRSKRYTTRRRSGSRSSSTHSSGSSSSNGTMPPNSLTTYRGIEGEGSSRAKAQRKDSASDDDERKRRGKEQQRAEERFKAAAEGHVPRSRPHYAQPLAGSNGGGGGASRLQQGGKDDASPSSASRHPYHQDPTSTPTPTTAARRDRDQHRGDRAGGPSSSSGGGGGGYLSSSSAASYHFTPTTPTPTLRMLPSDKEAADRLFAEYLRIINDKDEEIHRLIVELEKANLDIKKKDDKFKSRLKDLKESLLNLQSTAEDYKVKEEALNTATRENNALKSDIDTLRASLAESDARMQSVLKANEKAMKHESHARQKLIAEHERMREEWAEKMRSVQQQAIAAENQRDAIKMRNEEGEKDALRWKVEAQRLQEEALEYQRVTRDLKRQVKEMRPIAAVEVEIQQLETRHRALIEEYEREAEKARRANKDLSIKNSEFEIKNNELTHRLDDATRQANQLRTSNQDADVLIAQLRLEKQQAIEDIRADHQSQIKLLQQQIDKYYVDKVATEGELAVMRQRANDLEAAANAAADRFAADERRLQEHLSSVKAQLVDTNATLEATQRRLQQEATQLEQSEVNAVQLQEELRRAQLDLRRNEDLKAQLIDASKANEELRQKVRQLEMNVRDKDEALNEARNDLDVSRRDIRTEQTRKQQEVADLNQKIRFLEQEAQNAQKKALELNNQLALTEQKEKAGSNMIAELENGVNRMKEAVRDRDRTIEGLRADIDRLVKRNEDLQDTVDKSHDVAVAERSEKLQLQDQCGRLDQLLRQKEAAVETLNDDIRRIETAANQHEMELGRQLEQTRDRVQQLVKDLHTAQQQAGVARLDATKAEAKASDQISELQRSVVDPLQKRLEELQRTVAELNRDMSNRDEKVREQNELLNRQADLVEKLRVEVVSRDKRIATLEDGRDAKEREGSKRIQHLEDQIRELNKQIAELREKEIHQMQELAARRSEVVTWRERCANLESLKTIANNAVEEYKAREADMLEKIEEMHQAQQIMQTCFDKQQEQIELGKRLREQKNY